MAKARSKRNGNSGWIHLNDSSLTPPADQNSSSSDATRHGAPQLDVSYPKAIFMFRLPKLIGETCQSVSTTIGLGCLVTSP
jgi:hypothetical protein